MFWSYVDAIAMVVLGGGGGGDGMTWKAEGLTYRVKVGDHVRVGDTFFFSTVAAIQTDGTLQLRHRYVPTEEDAAKEKDKSLKEEGELEPMDVDTPSTKTDPYCPRKLYVKRTNRRLRNPSAINVALNFACLHEAAGRTVPAVELHKVILRRHPSYVNSYLRLACISRDCGSLPNCSEWLRSACAIAPGNSEVLCLVGNLHLSLCDWQPAQGIFDQLLTQKVAGVEA